MLTDHDVDGRDAEYYEEHIQSGGVFVSVDTRRARHRAIPLVKYSIGTAGQCSSQKPLLFD
jgi:hypothetical protein